MARQIKLTLLNDEVAKTTGLSVWQFTTALGIWDGLSENELHRRFLHWHDRNKYTIASVWRQKKRYKLIFKTGHTPKDQINSAIELVAGDGNENVRVDFREALKHVKFKVYDQTDEDLHRTFFHNLDSKWLPTNADSTYWTQYLAQDNEDPTYSSFALPLLPSVRADIYKAGFDPDAPID